MNQMDLRSKVGQLFTFSAFHEEVDYDTSRLITELKAGGMFIPTGCLNDVEKVHAMTNKMQQLSVEKGSGVPLFISADFVAGVGCKVVKGGTHFPKNRAIGVAGDEQLAYESGKVTAVESLAVGVNFNYSPVTDINNNPLNPVIGTHSFADNAEDVSRLGTAIIKAYQDHGVIATAKHFPGHGDTHVDSHEDLPVLSFDRERLENFELIPFKKAIEAGVDSIMVAHMAVPAFDPSLTPASLSYELITNLLRKQLGFTGLIVTDGLTMKGVTNQYTLEDACVRSILAGTDILLATAEQYDHAVSMYNAVLAAVENGTIPMERIDDAVQRIMGMKQKYNLLKVDGKEPFQSNLINQQHSEHVSEAIAKKALTVLHEAERFQFDLTNGEKWTLIHDSNATLFAEIVKEQIPGITVKSVGKYDEIAEAVKDCSNENVVIGLSHNAPIANDYLKLLQQRLSEKEKALWVHFGSEYDVQRSEIPTILLYDHAPSLQKEASLWMMKRIKIAN